MKTHQYKAIKKTFSLCHLNNDHRFIFDYTCIFILESVILKYQSKCSAFLYIFSFNINNNMEKSDQKTDSIHSLKCPAKIKINDQFVIQWLKGQTFSYKIYKGVDVTNFSYVFIYVRPYSSQNRSSMSIAKQQFKQKICPAITWKGAEKINKHLYEIQVHQKYGPSLKEILCKYKQKILEHTFYLLTYQSIRLIQKIANLGFVAHSLSLQNIILHSQPEQTQLFLLNAFDTKKKNQDVVPINTKYCSVGAHLGLKASFKDDLESICYILLDFYLMGRLMIENQNYLEFKTNLNVNFLEKLPKDFVEFYICVKSLDHNEEFNFSHWKSVFRKLIPQHLFIQPYQWIDSSKIKINKQQNQPNIKQNEDKWEQDTSKQPESQLKDEQLFDDYESMDQDNCQNLDTDEKISDKINRTSLINWNLRNKQSKI